MYSQGFSGIYLSTCLQCNGGMGMDAGHMSLCQSVRISSVEVSDADMWQYLAFEDVLCRTCSR
jgi:hypothetical protein